MTVILPSVLNDATFHPEDPANWGTADGGFAPPVDADALLAFRVNPLNWNGLFDNDLLGTVIKPAADWPFRLRIQWALTFALRQIHPDNGFYLDISSVDSVVRGRLDLGDAGKAPRPGVAIVEEPFAFEADLQPATGKGRPIPYELILQGFVKDEIEHPSDMAHILLADVKARLAALKLDENGRPWVFRIGSSYNSVTALSLDDGVVRPVVEQLVEDTGFWMRISLLVVENRLLPGA